MRTPRLLISAAALLFAVTACGGGESTPTAPAPETTQAPPASTATTEAGGGSSSEASGGQSSQAQIPGSTNASGTVTIDGTESDLGELQCVKAPTGTVIASVSPSASQGFALQLDAEGTITSFTVTIDSKPLIFAEGVGSGGELMATVSGNDYTVTGTLPDLTAGGKQVEVSAKLTCG